MAVKTAASKTQATGATQKSDTTGSAIAKDGTTLGYLQMGHGPAVILLHGSAQSAQSHRELGLALADTFTVILPDRRGRGLSGPYSKDYHLKNAVEDVEAILTKTGAHYVFGVSSGGLIMLQAALTLPAIHKVALFEPALVVNKSISTDILTRFDEEIAQGQIEAAMVTAMLSAQMGPPIFQSLPRWLLKIFTRMMMNSEDKKANPEDVTMRKLAPTIHYDFQLVVEMEDKQERFKDIKADVLLLGGSGSPAYLKTAVNTLAAVLPQAKRVEFPGVGHGASSNKDQWGQPELVAQELRKFFA